MKKILSSNKTTAIRPTAFEIALRVANYKTARQLGIDLKGLTLSDYLADLEGE